MQGTSKALMMMMLLLLLMMMMTMVFDLTLTPEHVAFFHVDLIVEGCLGTGCNVGKHHVSLTEYPQIHACQHAQYDYRLALPLYNAIGIRCSVNRSAK